jgi:SAM-dependent methyltransferase
LFKPSRPGYFSLTPIPGAFYCQHGWSLPLDSLYQVSASRTVNDYSDTPHADRSSTGSEFKVHAARTSYPRTSFRKSVRRFFFKSLLDTRARRLAPHITGALEGCSSLLDLGCGDMILTEYLHANTGLTLTAVDTIDSNLSRLPVIIYDGDRLPFGDRSFDATMVAYVLHHCSDIRAVLSEIRRVSARKIIIMEEVYENGIAEKKLHLHDFGNRFLSTSMKIPCNFLKIGEWNQLFADLGLHVENCTRIYQYPMLNVTHQVLFELRVE